jgi:hypothetical protein
MIYGTAGYTAGLAIERLEKVGMNIEDGPVLVRGASANILFTCTCDNFITKFIKHEYC